MVVTLLSALQQKLALLGLFNKQQGESLKLMDIILMDFDPQVGSVGGGGL